MGISKVGCGIRIEESLFMFVIAIEPDFNGLIGILDSPEIRNVPTGIRAFCGGFQLVVR